MTTPTDGPVKIEASGLTFYYGRTKALEDVSVRIRANLVTAFIGPRAAARARSCAR